MISVRPRHRQPAAVALRRIGLILALTFNVVASSSALRAAGLGQDQQSPDPGASGISATAMAQIDALMQEKASRTGIELKIDSRILTQLKAAIGQAPVPGLPRLNRMVNALADNRLELDVQATITASFLNTLRQLGAEVVNADTARRNVTILAALDRIELIAALPDVAFIQPKQQAVTGAALDMSHVLFSGTGQGSQTSEGDATHRAAAARGIYGVNGTGVKIGVLSNGVAHLADSQSLSDLGTVTVLPGQTGVGDEGTAMLEIIHDLAPGAQLYFATAFTSITSFAQNIRDLRAAGCDIIVDDVYYYGESPFQDGQAASVHSTANGGVVAQAVKDVTASGAMYFSSAGNSGNKDGGWSGTWEGDFVDGGASTLEAGARFHSFSGLTYDILTASAGNPIELFWADPLGAANDDYDLIVLDSTGANVIDYSTNLQSGTQDPWEAVDAQPAGSRIVILKYSGNGRFLHLGTNRGFLSVSTAGETHGHAATTASGSFAVAATAAGAAFSGPTGPYPGAFTSSNIVERFSSDGPRRIFFAADGTPLTPGNFSASGGQVLNKPDITAADGVSVTGVGGFGSPFYGTSAAAPHAAAIAALIKSKNLSLTSAQIRTALTGTAIDIHNAGVDRDSGAGIVMADLALQSLASPPTLTINDVSLAEGNSGTTTATFTVTLNPVNPAQTVTVNYATANGTATAGSDYVAASGTLTFNPSVATQNVAVTIKGDATLEPAETFLVNLASPVNALIGDSQGVGTITNDDVPPPPAVTITTPTVNPGGTISFSIANGPANPSDWVGLFPSGAGDTGYVDWQFLNGLKTAPVAGLPAATLQFTAPVTPGTYNVRLFASTGPKIATSGLATVQSQPALTISDVSVAEGNSGTTTATLTVTLNPVNPTQAVTVNYATVDGTATAGSDYVAASGTLTFAPSAATQAINITVNGDATLEPNETFVVNLTSPANAVIVDNQGIGTITNDDTPPGPTVTINTPSVNPGGTIGFSIANGPANPSDWVGLFPSGAGDTGYVDWQFLNGLKTAPPAGLPAATLQFTAPVTTGTYNVRLFSSTGSKIATSGLATVQVVPALTINDVSVTEGNSGTATAAFTVTLNPVNTTQTVTVNYATANGTATAGVDYVAAAGTLTFTPTTSTQTINVTVNGDVTNESDETFVVNLSSPANAAIADSQGTGAITNDDAPPAPSVTINTPSVNPGGTIGFSVANGPANATDWVALFSSAAADMSYIDWMYLNGTKTAPASGVSSATLQFTAPNPVGTYNVRLFASGGFTKLATSGTATVVPTPTLTINDVSMTEGNSGTATATFTVTLNPVNPTQAVTVNYATADGTATAGSDYAAASGTLTFAPSAATQVINVTVNGDATFEPNETFVVNLANPVNAVIADSQGAASIANDDAQPGPSVTINTPSVSPGGTIGFTIAGGPAYATDWVALYASGAPDNTFVDWMYLNGTTTPPAAGMSGATLQFTAPATAGTYNIRLFANNTVIKLATSGLVTVAPTPTLTINDVSVTEGNSGTTTATFTVTLNPANTTQAVTVNYGTANGTATAGSDYVSTSGTLTFTPSTATQTITVTVNGDVTNESSETFLVNLASPANAVIGDSQGVGTIVNDDAPSGASVTINTPTVNPGGTIGFSVASGPANASDWVALYSSSALDATFVDWMYLNGTKTLPAGGMSSATLQFTAPNPVGTYNVRLFANGGYTKLATSGMVTVVPPSGPSVTINTPTVAVGHAIDFTVAGGPANATDWVGLFVSSAPDNTMADWMYLNGSKTAPGTGVAGATIQFMAPATTGTYNVRFFANNTVTKLATSGTVTVTP